MSHHREAEPEAELPPDLEVVQVPGDGNCLFHALSHGDPSLGGGAALRAAVAAYLAEQAPHEGSQGQVWRDESTALRDNPRLYGGHTSIIAFSKMSGKRVEIHDRRARLVYQATHASVAPTAEAVHLLYNGRNHYNLLARRGDAREDALQVADDAHPICDAQCTGVAAAGESRAGKTPDYIKRFRALLQEGGGTLADIVATLRKEHFRIKAIRPSRLRARLSTEYRLFLSQGQFLNGIASHDSTANATADQHKDQEQEAGTDMVAGRKSLRAKHSIEADKLLREGRPAEEVFTMLSAKYPVVRPARLRAIIAKICQNLPRMCPRCGGDMQGRGLGYCKDSKCRAQSRCGKQRERANANACKWGPIPKPQAPKRCRNCMTILFRKRAKMCDACRTNASKRARTRNWSDRMEKAGVKRRHLGKNGKVKLQYETLRDSTERIEDLMRAREVAELNLLEAQARSELCQPETASI